jgi:hypothetical protein
MGAVMHSALFAVLLTLIFIIAYMAHYAVIQRKVRKESRCLKARLNYTSGAAYQVKAVNAEGKDLYRVTYDMPSKSVKHECACPSGNTVNHFPKIKYYDLKSAKDQVIPELLCNCDADYETNTEGPYYEGYPGLVRYMQNGDATFFTSIGGGGSAK